MAHSLSAQKRVRQNEMRRALNRRRKRTYREMVRQYDEAILHGSVEECQKQLSSLYKTLDQVAAKGTLHKKTASRYKSRLTARLAKKQTAASS